MGIAAKPAAKPQPSHDLKPAPPRADHRPYSHREIQGQFTSRAPVYDDVSAWVTDTGLLEAMVRQCRVPRTASLLDVCCGTGAVGGAFAGRVARRFGLDLTSEMLRQAGERLDACVVASAQAMPFAAATFDLVVCRQALHFVASPPAVLAEMFRVLRLRGQVTIGHRVPYGRLDAAWWESVNRAKQPLARNFFMAEDLERLMREAGFGDLTLAEYRLWESIHRWVDSPEARAASDEVFALYRSAPPEVVKLRGIQITDDEIRDCWRWVILSASKSGSS